MRKFAILMTTLFVFAACEDDKKAEEKQMDEAIHKIDSISNDVKKSMEDLEKTVKEVKEAVKELDNI